MNIDEVSDPIAIKEAQLRAKIAKLQAQQRRQRLIEDLETPRNIKSGGGFRFIHAFLIVLGLHVAAVGSFYGLSALRKMHSSDKMVLNEKPPVYVGVPDPSPKSSSASSLVQAPQSSLMSNAKQTPMQSKKKKQVEAVASRLPSHEAPSREGAKKEVNLADQYAQKITPAIKALFTHRPAPARVAVSQSSGAAEALASMGTNASDTGSTALVAPSRPAPPIPSEYTVAPGDTLSTVASSMHVSAAKICEANGLNPGSSLQVGRKLTIPTQEDHHPIQLVEKSAEPVSKKENDTEVFTPKMEKIAPNGVYTVQRGDNPYAIAHRLGVSFYELMTANDISNPADVTIGMHLKVPQKRIASN
jgi:LysM repeat protein